APEEPGSAAGWFCLPVLPLRAVPGSESRRATAQTGYERSCAPALRRQLSFRAVERCVVPSRASNRSGGSAVPPRRLDPQYARGRRACLGDRSTTLALSGAVLARNQSEITG